MSEKLPEHTIMRNGKHFLRLKVETRTEDNRKECRLVMEGDAATKGITEWSADSETAVAAFVEERARYK